MSMHHHHHHYHAHSPQPERNNNEDVALSQSFDAATRAAIAERATWFSVVVNLVLTVLQIMVGWVANSQSLIAHGLHSFSDLLSDFLVIYASRESANPADEKHPYGHARMETAATLVLGVLLMLVGVGVLWECGTRLMEVKILPPVEMAALLVAFLTLVGKEMLYRYLLRVAEKLRSQLLIANALHTRADAASALVVIVGIAGAMMGWSFLDLLAAAIMGFMILHMGVQLGFGALKELIDTGLDKAQVAEIEAALKKTPGVLDLHELRTRRMAQHALVDAHVQVHPRISVSEGHFIAESARQQVLKNCPDVLDVLVHIDSEDDLNQTHTHWNALPSRESILAALTPLPENMPPMDHLVLHYLEGKLDVDIHFSAAAFLGAEALNTLQEKIEKQLKDGLQEKISHIHRISLCFSHRGVLNG